LAKDSVILKLDGKVSVADFRTVVDAFSDLLMTLTAETNAEAAVDWLLSDLRSGSATLTSRGLFANVEGEHTIDIVVGRYEDLARAAGDGTIDKFSDGVQKAMRSLTSVVNGKIPRVFMGTPDEPELGKIERPIETVEDVNAAQKVIEPRPYNRAAIKGQIVSLDQKHGIYFTLQEAYSYRYVRCYPGKEHRTNLGNYWENRTWVIVEGTYIRYGDIPTMTQITDVVPLPDGAKGGWRAAIGAAPREPQAGEISSADAVRKVRDGQA
jgi:hypothetical protein